MKITKELAVQPEELYSFIKEMVYNDVKSNIKNIKSIDDIQEGIQYKKELKNKMGKNEIVTTRIERLNNHEYCVSFTGKQGKNTISYSFLPKDKNYTEVTYEETYEGVNTSTSFSYMIMSFITSRNSKKRMEKMLFYIEECILRQKTLL